MPEQDDLDSDLKMSHQVILQSKEHGDILNVIDELRSFGTSHYVDLPQVIVCGDQSSGKSSVLEAISGLEFPRKDNLCTRFATEVVLRRGPLENIDVSIVPGDGQHEQDDSRAISFDKRNVSLNDIGALVSEAGAAIGVGSESKNFSDDILRFEVTGPSQPQLTLVDLPGLFQVGNRLQSDEDSQAVTTLVLSYMKKARSIILAVVSAKNDFANQIVTKYAREVDPQGYRTLGIITKPDTLFDGSNSQKEFIELAQNRDVFLRYGWHTLKNRDFDTRNFCRKERDDAEQKFFSEGIWTSLSKDQVGVSSLRTRLSLLLRDQIVKELPSLVTEVESGISICKFTLGKLGKPRATLEEQKLYLLHASQTFTSLVQSAIDGSYNHSLFDSATSEQGGKMRLRAIVQNHLLDFSKSMRQEGHLKHIVDEETSSKQKKRCRSWVSRNEMIDEVLQLMKKSRGCELPGTYNPQIIGDLFFAQAKPWATLACGCIEKIFESIQMGLNLILNRAADERTANGLKLHFIDSALKKLTHTAEVMLTTILAPHQQGHPITYNHYFTDNVQKLKEAHRRNSMIQKLDRFFDTNIRKGNVQCDNKTFDNRNLLDSLSQGNVTDMDRYSCSEAIDCMKGYYKVAMKTFVDNLSVLVVEKCVIQQLPSLFTPENVIILDDRTIQNIASEMEESKNERTQTNIKLRALERALTTLKALKIFGKEDFNDTDREDKSSGKEDKEECGEVEFEIEDPENLTEQVSKENSQHGGSEHDSVEGNEIPTASTPVAQPVSPATATPPDNDQIDSWSFLKTKDKKKGKKKN